MRFPRNLGVSPRLSVDPARSKLAGDAVIPLIPSTERPAMKITVSGKSFYGACDPLCSDVSAEEGWPKPTARKVGRGWQYVYEGDATLAVQIASHLECLAEGFSYSDDADALAEGRAFAKDAARIRKAL